LAKEWLAMALDLTISHYFAVIGSQEDIARPPGTL